MEPVIFQTLPKVFSFVAVALLLEVSALLMATGRRYLKVASLAVVGITGAVMGEGMALATFTTGAWLGAAVGAAGGIVLCKYLRPVGVGVSLAFLAFYGATYLVDFEYIQFVAALVLFTYGLLLTDLAPTFVASLLASSIFFLSGVWVGLPIPLLLTIVIVAGLARILVTVIPTKFTSKAHPAVFPSRNR